VNDQEIATLFALISEPGNPILNLLLEQMGYQGVYEFYSNLVNRHYRDEMQQQFDWFYDHPGKKLSESKYDRTAITAANLAKMAHHQAERNFEKTFKIQTEKKIEILLQTDPNYPKVYEDLKYHKPLVLFYLGNVDLMKYHKNVAIVGTRNCDHYGRNITLDLARTLVENGFIVTSGGAIGIDSYAHQGAIGNSVAIMAGGLDELYPKESQPLLLENLQSGGLCISEMPAATPTAGRFFLLRNRLIAALAQATIIIEAAWRSGAINTAHTAADLNRVVGAVPGDGYRSRSLGTNQLIRQHKAELVASPHDLLTLLSLNEPDAKYIEPEAEYSFNGSYRNASSSSQTKTSQKRKTSRSSVNPIDWKSLSLPEQTIIQSFKNHESNLIEQLVMRTNLTPKQLLPELTHLELKGLIVKTDFGYQLA
jgi:DNA processing protein